MRGGAMKPWAAALFLGLCLALPGAALMAQDSAAPETTAPADIDTGAPIYLYTHDTCRSIFAAAAPEPMGACDCMTPILMRRLTPEARERIAQNPDQLPFGVTLFRDATPEEEAEQRACME